MKNFPRPKNRKRVLTFAEQAAIYPGITEDDLPWDVIQREDLDNNIVVRYVAPKARFLQTVSDRGQHILDKEPWTNQWLRKVIKSDTVFYDVGANCGQYSLYAHALGCKRIYAFEPNIKNVYYMLENIRVNNARNSITVMPFPLKERNHFSKWISKEAGDGFSGSDTTKGTVSMLNVRTIDSLQNDLDSPTVIKVDVDGTLDTLILEGALESLNKVQHIMIEIQDWENWNKFLPRLMAKKFRVNEEWTRMVREDRSGHVNPGLENLCEVFLEK